MPFYRDDHGDGTIQVGALKGSTGADLYKFSMPFMVLTTLSLALRIYVRGYMTKTFGLEDWLIIPAYILFMVLCICVIVVGQWLLREDAMERYPRIIKLTIGTSVLFILDQIFIKLSVAAYFYRFCERWQRYVIVGTVSIFTLYNLAFLFVSVFQCGVPTVLNLVRPNIDGHCINWSHIVKPLLYVGVSLNAVCDWVFVLACLPVLAKLRRMPTGEMVCVCFLIFLATGASVLSLVRIRYIPGGGTDVLLLKHNQDFAVLSFTEAGTAIVTVCMATLHPLFKAFIRKRGSSRCPASSSPRKPDSSEPAPEVCTSEKRPTDPSSEELSTEHSNLGRIGILPTIYDTELGTMAEHNSPRLGYTNDWT
ncbi:hypothetical protein AUEXF2481DRAFT_328851 [Aureobasidium subglaciale EXF-2481]|uniref:Rhodopsin domain-containing protein n=1 Tax=Aureobasidium subglaciale (strain EXF-2481) TaxID=1043005 RepID=A0A074Y7A8_AURSE|nr:uncharacterized protein AUEXF2481DRAFT_328851 [Aureobasidium subglaciale EXF-2481]KEQ93633.1 hypothetical protein AUEXF2481DRAFT_328851 [Aureobasidium subglaciale EXF-2481]